jgi:murein DD-endopeptidase MepM/ murein hydrolase activator NlpD
VVIHIRPNEPAEVQASLGGQPLRLFPAGTGFWAVVGVDADEQAGQKDLVVEGRDRVGNPARAQGSVAVAPFTFTRDALEVAPAMLPLLAPNVRAAEDDRLKAVYQRENGPPLWKGAFTLPVRGPISTEFGEVRSYNGSPFGGHHGGTDFQVGLNVPVLAPARGRVVLREEVRLRGKVLVLDHGGGVYTTYAHLEDWTAGENQEVEAGQPIAKVGSTGLSTGPHLHWELWVGGKNVNPLEWTEREVP